MVDSHEAWEQLVEREHERLAQQRSGPGPYSVKDAAHNGEELRYGNIVPFDRTRVKLKSEPSTYLNASWIRSEKSPAFIATQAPIPFTFVPFFRMVLDHKCPLIVTLGRVMETDSDGKLPPRHLRSLALRMHAYWPDQAGRSVEFTRDKWKVHVTLEKIVNRDSWVERLLRVRCTRGKEVEREHYVTQMHYTEWPDFGVPQDPQEYLDVIRRFRVLLDERPGVPVIHCSAGVGRTGTFAATWWLSEWLQHHHPTGAGREALEKKAARELVTMVDCMKDQRAFMVQRFEQYHFIVRLIPPLTTIFVYEFAT